MDCYYHKPEFKCEIQRITQSPYTVKKLRDLCIQISDGTHYTPSYVTDGIPFLSVKDVREFEISFKDTKYISKQEHKKLSKRCKPVSGDILLTKVGTIGLSTVVPDNCPEFSLFVSVCLIKPDNTTIDPYFLCAVLNTSIARLQFSRALKGISVPDLHLENISETLIPLPDINKQRKLVAGIKTAHERRKKNLTQAEGILRDIDAILLEQFNLCSTLKKRKRCFAIRLRQIDGPINPDRYSMMLMESNIKGTTIEKVANIMESKISPSKEAPNDKWDWIRIDDLPNEPLGVDIVRTDIGKNIVGTFFTVRENDILIARLGPTILNRKFVLCPELKRKTVASAEFLVLHCYKDWNPLVVVWVLRTSLYQDLIYSKGRGATPSRYRVNREDLAALPFPSIDIKKQNELADMIKQRLDDIRSLRKGANREWEQAKKSFEAQLLGEGIAL